MSKIAWLENLVKANRKKKEGQYLTADLSEPSAMTDAEQDEAFRHRRSLDSEKAYEERKKDGQKKFPDPIAANQMIAKLLEERKQAKVSLENILKDQTAEEKSIESARRDLQDIEEKLIQAGHKGPKTKELSKALREKDEEEHVDYADTAEKRAQSQVHVEKGLVVDSENKVLDGRHGYVVSAADGAKHVFNEEEGTAAGKKLHHSSPVAGGAVTAAGEQIVEKGIIREIGDQSGHYKPDGEMVHQYVQGLIDEGANMRDETIVAMGADGKMRVATPEEIKFFQDNQDKLQELPAKRKIREELRQKLGWYELKEKSAKYPDDEQIKNDLKRVEEVLKPVQDPIDELEAIQKTLSESGIGPKNKDAKVLTYKATTRFNPEEWAVVKGDRSAIVKLIIKKLGSNRREDDEVFTRSIKDAKLDPNDMGKTNDFIALLMRIAEYPVNAGLIDKSVAYNSSEVDQFAQTGGNAKAIQGKQAVNAELEKSQKTNIVKEIDALGGKDKLGKLGFDASKLTQQQQLAILEFPGLSGNVAETLQSLGINDPTAHDSAGIIELLESADTFKNIGVARLEADTFTVDELLNIIEISKTFTDLENVKDTVKANKKDWDELVEDLKEAKKFDELGGRGEVAQIVGDPSEFPVKTKIDLLARAKEFKDLNGPETIEKYGLTYDQSSSVDALLDFLQTAKEFKDLNGPEKAEKLVGDTSDFPLTQQIEIVRRAKEFEELDALATIEQYGLTDDHKSSVDKLLKLLQDAKYMKDDNHLDELKKLVGEPSKFGLEEQVEILNAATQFEGIDGPATLKLWGVDEPWKIPVSQLIQFLSTAKRIEDIEGGLGAYRQLDPNGMVTMQRANHILGVLERLKPAREAVEALHLEPDKMQVSQLFEILDNFQRLKALGLDQIEKCGIDLYNTSAAAAVKQIEQKAQEAAEEQAERAAAEAAELEKKSKQDAAEAAALEKKSKQDAEDLEFENLGGANELKSLGFTRAKLPHTWVKRILARKEDFRGLGGEERIKELGLELKYQTFEGLLEILQAAKKLKDDFGVEASKYRDALVPSLLDAARTLRKDFNVEASDHPDEEPSSLLSDARELREDFNVEASQHPKESISALCWKMRQEKFEKNKPATSSLGGGNY